MGLFRSGAPDQEVREFTMFRTFKANGHGHYTLGYPTSSGGRLWIVVVGQWFDPALDLTRDPTDVEYQEFIDGLNSSAIEAIRKHYPSAAPVDGPLSGVFPEKDPQLPVVTQGSVRVSASDHQMLLQSMAK